MKGKGGGGRGKEGGQKRIEWNHSSMWLCVANLADCDKGKQCIGNLKIDILIKKSMFSPRKLINE